MIHVLVCTRNELLLARIRDAIGANFVGVRPHEPVSTAQQLLDLAGAAATPHVVVLDADGDDDTALAVSQELLSVHGIATVLATPNAVTLALPALRSGVRDLVTPDASAADLKAALDRAASAFVPQNAPIQHQEPGPSAEGRVIAVVSPKGGVGKTTVASNLAVGLAQRTPNGAVLVDLDIHFGDCASALNVQATHTLPDIARGSASYDSLAVKSFLARHETGLFLVPGSDDPAAADSVSPADITRLLRLLRSQFRYVIVDTAPGLSEHTLAVLDEADSLVMVTSLDVPGVRGLRKEIDTLAALHLDVGARHIVLNFYDASRGLTIADVEGVIRAKVDVVIPQSNVVPLSVNQGIPLMQGGGRDPVSQRLRTLVDLVAPAGNERRERKKWFGR